MTMYPQDCFREENKNTWEHFQLPPPWASLTFFLRTVEWKASNLVSVLFFFITRWGNIIHRIVWGLSQPHQPRVHVQWELQQQPAVLYATLLWFFIPTIPQWIPWFLTHVHQQQQLEFWIRRGGKLIMFKWIPERPWWWKCTQFTQQISCHPY